MILVDTTIWADHIARPDQVLAELLGRRLVISHPFVVGEIALGNLRDRIVLGIFQQLPSANTAFDSEVLMFIERHGLPGCGIGYVDAHLMVSACLSGARLWTRDRRLRQAAERLDLVFDPDALS